jgi:hypothetical protein
MTSDSHPSVVGISNHREFPVIHTSEGSHRKQQQSFVSSKQSQFRWRLGVTTTRTAYARQSYGQPRLIAFRLYGSLRAVNVLLAPALHLIPSPKLFATELPPPATWLPNLHSRATSRRDSFYSFRLHISKRRPQSCRYIAIAFAASLMMTDRSCTPQSAKVRLGISTFCLIEKRS